MRESILPIIKEVEDFDEALAAQLDDEIFFCRSRHDNSRLS